MLAVNLFNPQTQPGSRFCAECSTYKSESDFVADLSHPNRCKACHAAGQTRRRNETPARVREIRNDSRRRHPETHKVWVSDHKEELTAYNRVYQFKHRAENIVQYILKRAQVRAAERGWDFNLEPQDIQIPSRCPILGIPLEVTSRGYSDNSVSLDRIDSTKGYVKGNVAVISRLANIIKSSGTAEQHELIANWMRTNGAV